MVAVRSFSSCTAQHLAIAKRGGRERAQEKEVEVSVRSHSAQEREGERAQDRVLKFLQYDGYAMLEGPAVRPPSTAVLPLRTVRC